MTHHDFTNTRWGHSIVGYGPGRFSTWSTPTVHPGDTITYMTSDRRKVTYRVLKDGYKWSINIHDMARFNAEKAETLWVTTT